MAQPQPSYRTVAHRTCALNGIHTPGWEAEAECPLNPARLQERSARAQKAARARWRRPELSSSIGTGGATS